MAIPPQKNVQGERGRGKWVRGHWWAQKLEPKSVNPPDQARLFARDRDASNTEKSMRAARQTTCASVCSACTAKET
eukprot:2141975-Alexandrium_andersonii.AAC.1